MGFGFVAEPVERVCLGGGEEFVDGETEFEGEGEEGEGACWEEGGVARLVWLFGEADQISF